MRFEHSVLFGLLLLLIGCKIEELALPLFAKSPRQQYVNGLEKSNLLTATLTQRWLTAGEEALQDSISLTVPAELDLYFDPLVSQALSYRLPLQRGTVVRVTVQQDSSYRLFTELFQLAPVAATPDKLLAYIAKRDTFLQHEVEEDGTYLLRLQPELLAGGRARLIITTQPLLGMPVEGVDNSAIQSLFGAARDGGRRKHEGIDIFAPRGTPVTAVVPGRVRIKNGGLGGKTVWVSDATRRQSLYYAHLDSQWVDHGQLVRVGDTLGEVGNTGNARHTPSHLHFGIYTWGSGAIDPLAFVKATSQHPSPVRADTALLGHLLRTTRRRTYLRSALRQKQNMARTLPRHLPLQVVAAHGESLQVRTPDGKTGFVPATQMGSATAALRTHTVSDEAIVYVRPDTLSTPIAALSSASQYPVYGELENFLLVGYADTRMGWIKEQGAGGR